MFSSVDILTDKQVIEMTLVYIDHKGSGVLKVLSYILTSTYTCLCLHWAAV